MSVLSRVSALLLAATPVVAFPGMALTEQPTPKTQYVLVSFDGAHDVQQWERSRALAAKTGARFTYFLSCVYVLTPETKGIYKAPGHGSGRSNVGFGASTDEVKARLRQIWQARAEHHEIASHGCGHFDGSKWSEADWNAEFDAFTEIVRDAWSISGIEGEPEGWRAFADSEIRGFRAPYLATGKALYSALAAHRFGYDASGVSKGPVQVDRTASPARFALPQIPEGPSERNIIAMDYNLFVRHSGGIEAKDRDQIFETRAYDAFKSAFQAEYRGKRTPLQVGFHFSLMNGGAYWNALERFAGEVCVKPGVVCTSYADYLRRTSDEAPSKPAEGG